jgi:hypothetical protein
MQKYDFFLRDEYYFKKDTDNAIRVMINAMKTVKLICWIPTLETKHNARKKTLE